MATVALFLLLIVLPVIPAARHGPDEQVYVVRSSEISTERLPLSAGNVAELSRGFYHRFRFLMKGSHIPPSGPSKGHNSVGLDGESRSP
ncbi:hypothetical protein SUGI_1199520 [Cryptomeria japonica]|nr:hypothetical protein SUGI_1199520 [Cryptomeria japonica]